MAEESLIDQERRFLRWAEKMGIRLDTERIQWLGPSSRGGRGAFTKAEVEESAEIAHVPRSAMLSPETTALPAFASRVAELAAREGAPWLPIASAVVMAERALGNESEFFEFLSVLPKQERLPWRYESMQLKPLAGTETAELAREERRAAAREHREIVNPAWREFFGCGVDFDEYSRARSLACSRASSAAEGVPGITPGCDMLNHVQKGEEMALMEKVGQDEGSVMRASSRLYPGQEVLTTYGFRSNAKLMTSYGFALHYNAADVVSVPVSVLRAGALRAGCSAKSVREGLQGMDDEPFELSHEDALPTDLLTACASARRGERIATGDEGRLSLAKASSDVVASSLATRRWVLAGGSLEDDREELQGAEQEWLYNAILCRLGEKDILRKASDALQELVGDWVDAYSGCPRFPGEAVDGTAEEWSLFD